jgi:hypothetical protein
MIYHTFADVVLIGHAFFVAFVVGGFVAVTLGAGFHWRWVRIFFFRMAHLIAIVAVVLQTWIGIVCPLTTWEMQLRVKAGAPTYQESFMAHWLHTLLFFEAPDWVFNLCYSLFGCAVLGVWFLVPPHMPWEKTSSGA